ncbi:MAG: sugar porter family MFS transporter [Opitutaceae bacterium]|nr:sugar porter family MFS transporter [Opitutaceae bacterium]
MQTHTDATTPSLPQGAVYNRLFLWSTCLVAALGGLLFGYDWVVISGADIFYEKYFGLTTAADVGWAKSCALAGCLFGALFAGALSDRFGRKRLLIFSAVLFVVSSVGTGMADQFSSFVTWRIAGGAAIGVAANLSPMYIAEIAPAEIRGRLVSLNQLNIVIGILLAQSVNWFIAEPIPVGASALDVLNSWNGQQGWRWMFCLTAIPSALFFVGMLLVPESPRWLVKNGQRGRAQSILARLGGDAYATASVAAIEATLVNEIRRVDFRELFQPDVRRIVGFGVLLAFIVQWCGINVIFYYTKDIFAAAGFEVSAILLNIIIVGAVNLVFTFVAIQTVDRLGRRWLTLSGWGGLTVIFLVMGWCFHTGTIGVPVVALVMLAIGCYASTIAPMCWVTLSEIFPNRIRGAAMATAVFALWVGNFMLTFAFPTMLATLGPSGTFWVFAGICAVGFTLMKLWLPETKGKTLEQIEEELVHRPRTAAVVAPSTSLAASER